MHTIEPERRTLHGHFSRDRAPVLTIQSRETVRFRTLDAGWGMEGPETPRAKFEPRDPETDNGHALCGPIAIEGAEPGMTLEVRMDAIEPGTWGWQAAGGWPSTTNDALGMSSGKDLRLNWYLEAEHNRWRSEFGHVVASRPFMGVMGMPADESGLQSTTPPRVTGGNMDCKELVAGSSLFLPIAVPGGLFSVGDGHGAQGDGEVCGTAIECPMERVDLTFVLHENLHLTTPRAHTPAGWLTFGFDRDLDTATHIALNAVLELMQELHGYERLEALSLASLVVEMRITQIVNDVRGVHALLPHNLL